jgi:hypothetical protein
MGLMCFSLIHLYFPTTVFLISFFIFLEILFDSFSNTLVPSGESVGTCSYS